MASPGLEPACPCPFESVGRVGGGSSVVDGLVEKVDTFWHIFKSPQGIIQEFPSVPAQESLDGLCGTERPKGFFLLAAKVGKKGRQIHPCCRPSVRFLDGPEEDFQGLHTVVIGQELG